MFKAVITDIPLLRDSISSIAEIIDEGIFKINKDGIGLVAADRAMVAVVDLNIFSKAFEKYELDKDIAIGLNVSNLLYVIKRASPNDKITMNLENNKLELLIEGSSKRRFTIPVLDLSQEEVPPIDQLEFTSESEVKPEVIESGIQDAEIVADSVLFEASPSKFVMRAEGDVNKAELELEKGNVSLLSLKADQEVRSRYP